MKHLGAGETTAFEFDERTVGFFEAVGRHFGAEVGGGGERQEFFEVEMGDVGDRFDLALQPEVVVVAERPSSASLSRSSLRMALITSRPPGRRLASAATTGFQAGVVSMMAWRSCGARSDVSPAQSAPSLQGEISLVAVAGEHVDG